MYEGAREEVGEVGGVERGGGRGADGRRGSVEEVDV